MQGFRNYNIDAMQRDQLHVVDLMPPQYGKSTPPMSPNSGKFEMNNQRAEVTLEERIDQCNKFEINAHLTIINNQLNINLKNQLKIDLLAIK